MSATVRPLLASGLYEIDLASALIYTPDADADDARIPVFDVGIAQIEVRPHHIVANEEWVGDEVRFDLLGTTIAFYGLHLRKKPALVVDPRYEELIRWYQHNASEFRQCARCDDGRFELDQNDPFIMGKDDRPYLSVERSLSFSCAMTHWYTDDDFADMIRVIKVNVRFSREYYEEDDEMYQSLLPYLDSDACSRLQVCNLAYPYPALEAALAERDIRVVIETN
jgi:hypothetical protein